MLQPRTQAPSAQSPSRRLPAGGPSSSKKREVSMSPLPPAALVETSPRRVTLPLMAQPLNLGCNRLRALPCLLKWWFHARRGKLSGLQVASSHATEHSITRMWCRSEEASHCPHPSSRALAHETPRGRSRRLGRKLLVSAQRN